MRDTPADVGPHGAALQALGLAEVPLRIECYDISNLQGTEIVGSMVVFEDGLPRKSEYRRFVVRSLEGQNDVGAMHEVVTRRFRRLLDERVEHPDLGTGSGEIEEAGPRMISTRSKVAASIPNSVPTSACPNTLSLTRWPLISRRMRLL